MVSRLSKYQLSLIKVDTQSTINWMVVGQLSWQYMRQSTTSLSQWFSNSVYSTFPSCGFICDRWYLYSYTNNLLWCYWHIILCGALIMYVQLVDHLSPCYWCITSSLSLHWRYSCQKFATIFRIVVNSAVQILWRCEISVADRSTTDIGGDTIWIGSGSAIAAPTRHFGAASYVKCCPKNRVVMW